MRDLKSVLRGHSPGVTMIELVAALVILAILAAVVASRSSLSTDSAVVGESEALKSHLRFAQNRSMNSNLRWGMTAAANAYSMFTYNAGTGASATVSLPGYGESSHNLGAQGCSVSSFTVSFDSWGRPCSGTTGVSALSADMTISVSKGGNSEIITIKKNTGFIP